VIESTAGSTLSASRSSALFIAAAKAPALRSLRTIQIGIFRGCLHCRNPAQPPSPTPRAQRGTRSPPSGWPGFQGRYQHWPVTFLSASRHHVPVSQDERALEADRRCGTWATRSPRVGPRVDEDTARGGAGTPSGSPYEPLEPVMSIERGPARAVRRPDPDLSVPCNPFNIHRRSATSSRRGGRFASAEPRCETSSSPWQHSPPDVAAQAPRHVRDGRDASGPRHRSSHTCLGRVAIAGACR